MKVQNIQSTNYANQNFKAKVNPSDALMALKKSLDHVDRDTLNTYIRIIEKSPSNLYYRYALQEGQPVIYSAKIGEKFPIENSYKNYQNPLDLFIYVADMVVGYSSATPELYTEAEKEFVKSNMFVIG